MANDKEEFPGYPSSPNEDDIYNKGKKVKDDLEDENEDMEMDLDVPGSELDNDWEAIGEEDEENNYYSLDDQEDDEDDDY